MSESSGRRPPKKLSAETKWEIFLQVTAGEITQADAARKWQVDVSTIIGIRRTVKDAALAALSRAPGRPAEGTQLGARGGAGRDRGVDRGDQGPGDRAGGDPGKVRLGLSGPLPARVPADVKELVLKTVDDAVADGFPHGWVCSLWQVSDDRVHRWRARRRDVGHPRRSSSGREPGARHPARRRSTPSWPSPRRGGRSTGRIASSPTGAPTKASCGSHRRRSGVFWLLTASSCPNR